MLKRRRTYRHSCCHEGNQGPETKRADFDKEIESYLKELGLVE